MIPRRTESESLPGFDNVVRMEDSEIASNPEMRGMWELENLPEWDIHGLVLSTVASLEGRFCKRANGRIDILGARW